MRIAVGFVCFRRGLLFMSLRVMEDWRYSGSGCVTGYSTGFLVSRVLFSFFRSSSVLYYTFLKSALELYFSCR